jgi:hypothetical protein
MGNAMKHWKDINWLWVAGVFSIGYAAIVGSALGWSRSWAFFTTDPKLNEAGDFLAGVFAPLALIWLVAAVLTQRQELNETRDQFTENQKVVDAQLKTINSQNDLLKLQHEQAVGNAKKAYKLSLFDKRYQLYEKFIAFGEAHSRKDFDDDSYLAMTNLAQESGFIFDSDFEGWLGDIAEQISDYVHYKANHPLRMTNDGMGNRRPISDEKNTELQLKYDTYTSWIEEQFFPHDRTAKFHRFMNVNEETDTPET